MPGEMAAERYALRASDFMSELKPGSAAGKLRPAGAYGGKCGRACDPGNFKTRTLHKTKSAAPAKDKRSLRCFGKVGHPPSKLNITEAGSFLEYGDGEYGSVAKGKADGKRMLGEKAAERCALRASDFMSELKPGCAAGKLRPAGAYGEKCGRARDPRNFKTCTLHKTKSAAPAKDKRSLRCFGRVGHPPEYAARGVEFARGLANMPWHSREFVVKDREGD